MVNKPMHQSVLFLIFNLMLVQCSLATNNDTIKSIDQKEEINKLYSYPHYYEPVNNLRKEDINFLKEFWLKDPINLKDIDNSPHALPLNRQWSTAEDFDHLNILCLFNEKYKIPKNESQHNLFINAIVFLNHFLVQLSYRGDYINALEKAYLITHPNFKGNILDSTLDISDAQSIINLTDNILSRDFIPEAYTVLSERDISYNVRYEPIIPIIQKITKQFAHYHKKYHTLLDELDPKFGKILITEGQNNFIFAWVDNWLPITISIEKYFEGIAGPYKPFTNGGELFIIFKDGNIETDSGFLIENKVKKNDLSSFIIIHKYFGLHDKHSFTRSPCQFSQHHYIDEDNIQSHNLPYIPNFLKDEIPEIDQSSFIRLPSTEMDKNIVELMFLEYLEEEFTNNNNPSIQQLIEFIQIENKQALQETITILQETIIAQQQEISKAVIQNKIVGRFSQEKKAQSHNTKSKQKINKKVNKTKAQNEVIFSTNDTKRKTKSEIIKELKDQRRTSYEKVLKILNTIIKERKNEISISQSVKGSHIVFHSQKGSATLVNSHGKCKNNDMRTKSVLRFFEAFLDL